MFFAELGEQELIQQGIKRFSVRNLATPSSWRYLGNPAEVAVDQGSLRPAFRLRVLKVKLNPKPDRSAKHLHFDQRPHRAKLIPNPAGNVF